METIDKELEKKRNRKIEKIKNLFKSLGKRLNNGEGKRLTT